MRQSYVESSQIESSQIESSQIESSHAVLRMLVGTRRAARARDSGGDDCGMKRRIKEDDACARDHTAKARRLELARSQCGEHDVSVSPSTSRHWERGISVSPSQHPKHSKSDDDAVSYDRSCQTADSHHSNHSGGRRMRTRLEPWDKPAKARKAFSDKVMSDLKEIVNALRAAVRAEHEAKFRSAIDDIWHAMEPDIKERVTALRAEVRAEHEAKAPKAKGSMPMSAGSTPGQHDNGLLHIGTPAGIINIFHLGHTHCYF